MRKFKKTISGWGNYPIRNAYLMRPEKLNSLSIDDPSVIARGLGRSYGDASLNTDKAVLLMERLNRFLSFDEKKGLLKAEAGASLEEILEVFVPRGWFLPVTPGTKFVTLGGCVAADVHGKNHHVDGSFSEFVTEMEILLADGSKKKCSKKMELDLFWATVGGMGLTGIITEVTIQLIPIQTAYIAAEYIATKNLDDTLKKLDEDDQETKYSVAWIDCLSTKEAFGRGIVMKGRHATLDDLAKEKSAPLKIKRKRKFSIPFNLPSWFLNYWSISAANTLYYKFQGQKKSPFILDYETFFYPLDAINHWNRLYGKKGFVQYQFVVPLQDGRECLQKFLEELTMSRRASFLAVLKKFGREGQGMLSFPFEGYTLAVDIPVSDAGLFPFLDKLDALILKYHGRVYLAKDARLSSETFRSMYPNTTKWQQFKLKIDSKNVFSSDLSRRLLLAGQK